MHRGSLTLANQHEGTTPEQAEFVHQHKAEYQLRKSQQPRTCTRCKTQFRPGQRGGCKYHPGAQEFVCKNEGTANERYIFDHYDCCQKTVLDSPGETQLTYLAYITQLQHNCTSAFTARTSDACLTQWQSCFTSSISCRFERVVSKAIGLIKTCRVHVCWRPCFSCHGHSPISSGG